MKYALSAAAIFAATVSADFCSLGSTDDNGNWYCHQVNAITYTGVGGSASYNKVNSMDSTSGQCGSSPFGYSGTLAPLNEEVSMHFRGPLNLKKFAFYAPSQDASTANKRSTPRQSAAERRNAHGHKHAHLHKRHDHEERAVGDIVTATINGVVQTWVNEYSGVATSAPAAPLAAASSAVNNIVNGVASAVAGAASSAASNDEPSASFAGKGWTRQGFYDAESGKSEGLTFLNHNGGSGSGVFDYSFGNSLSYASTNGQDGSATPQVLADTTLPSNTEVVIMSDNKCTDDSCGFYRDGTVAYHGFDGADKAFFFEFEMPSDGQTTTNIYDPVNMPAIWMLNAQIPRTLQYGNAECSCWVSGCGEFDIFEVLAPGDTRLKSTLHGNIAGGSSDYFLRPENGTIQATALLYNNNIHVKILNQNFNFGKTMGSTWVTEMCKDTLTQSLSTLTSLFALSS